MRALTTQEVAAAMGGRVLGQIMIPRVTGVSTDSRELAAGSLFFAIKGPRFDGHAFVNEVLERGAAAAVVSDPSAVDAKYHDRGRLILVADVVEALGKLAGWYRRRFAATVIGVVGSNGKTTTKDMIATVLRSKKRGHAAPASFNNAIGVPLTLLAVDPADEFVVVEIGTNHPGEVAALGRIAQPNVAVITSIGEEHLEFFGDIESVAREEFSLLGMMGGSSGSSPAPMSRTGGGRGFVALSEQAARHAPGGTIRNHHTLTYGIGEQADLRAVDLVMDGEAQKFKVNGRFEYRLPVLGAHNVVNVLAAIVIGSRLRLTHEEMAAAVTDIRLRPMRMERSTAGGITFINDAYNANPSSMRAAFNVMDGLSEAGRKVFILGDMRELGDQADRCHRAVGCAAGRSTAHVIIAVGAHARVVADGATATAGTTKRIYSFPTIDALADRLSGLIEPGAVVLLKASRAIGLERLIEVLEQAGRPLAAK